MVIHTSQSDYTMLSGSQDFVLRTLVLSFYHMENELQLH